MAFKKYVGIVSGAVQKYVDHNLAKCPFCGEQPEWVAAPEGGVKNSYEFRCSQCGAVISVPTQAIVNPFKIMPENLDVLDCGKVNANRLIKDTTYSVQFLITSGVKLAGTNAIKRDLADPAKVFVSPPELEEVFSPVSSPKPQKQKKANKGRVVLTVLILILLFGTTVAAVAGIVVNSNRLINQAQVQTIDYKS